LSFLLFTGSSLHLLRGIFSFFGAVIDLLYEAYDPVHIKWLLIVHAQVTAISAVQKLPMLQLLTHPFNMFGIHFVISGADK
jgi:hypothetical protein